MSRWITACLILFATLAQADYPDQAMLDELRARIAEPPECHPGCAAVQTLTLDLAEARWAMTFEIHAETAVGVPLPASDGQWWPNDVRLDDDGAVALARDAQGTLWALAPPGRHRLSLQGPPALRNQVDLPLPMRPARVVTTADSGQWIVNGLSADGVPEQALQLIRRRDGGTAAQGLEPGVLPPLLAVTRTLELGLDWGVVTRVARQSPAGSPLIIDLPMLEGEAVTTADIEVHDGQARIRLAAGADAVTFRSHLAQRERLVLRAADDVRWSETWRMDVAPIWHVEYAGLPVVHHQDGEGAWLPTFAPYPGETLEITVTRPAAVAGNLQTIDQSQLTVTAGQRATDATLSLVLRASQGGQHRVTLPEGAQLRSAIIDGKTQPMRAADGVLVVPVHPGRQRVSLEWRQERPIDTLLQTPAVDLGMPSVNHTVTLGLGSDRWILFAYGPRMGPAVLFWSTLLVVVLLALLLGRSGRTPLKTHHWILLGIGLTQVDIVSALLVVAWLFAIDARARLGAVDRPYVHNLLQLGLVVLTLFALSELFDAVSRGLLGYPEMQIQGNASSAYRLNWYQDRAAAVPAQAGVVSVPLWVYRVAMLGWALWLAFALLSWLKWGWSVLARDGLWRRVGLERLRLRPRRGDDGAAPPSAPAEPPPG